jgi:hypothetical protein
MYFGLGWKGRNGLGIEILEANYLIPDAEFFQYLDLKASLGRGMFYGELYAEIPTYKGGMDYGAYASLKGELEFKNGFKAYASQSLNGIGSDDVFSGGTVIGLKKRF